MPAIYAKTLLVLVLILGACNSEKQAPLVATDIVITATMPGGKMSAGYLSLHNNTRDAIRISHVTSPQFDAVEIHESSIDDGIAKMRRVPELLIPAGSTVSLQRGGLHLMLMRPTTHSDSVSLSFFDDTTLVLDVSAPLGTGSN